MALIPEYLLKKLYLAGSLANADDGWRFALKNTLAKATVTSLESLSVDGANIPLNHVTIAFSGSELKAGGITPEVPQAFPINVPVTFRVAGSPLAPGSHSLKISLVTKEFGPVEFSVTDAL